MPRLPTPRSVYLLLAVLVALAIPAHAQEGVVQQSQTAANERLVDLFETHRHEVISVETEFASGVQDPRRFFGAPDGEPIRGDGSGFIVSADGEAITNWHVVAGAQSIQVTTSDGSAYTARLVGADPSTDIALLQIDTPRPLESARLGSAHDMAAGQPVFTIGNPFGLEQSVTQGVLSAMGRQIGMGPYDDFLQTDAAINPGNSGGPLYNLDGEVIGVNTAIIPFGGGIGFAVPIDRVVQILSQLRERGWVVRGYIGAGIQEMSPDLAATFDTEPGGGVLLRSIEEGGPADQAGLRPGDIVTSISGVHTGQPDELLSLVARLTPRQEVDIEFLRNGSEQRATIEIGERPDPQRDEVRQTLAPEPTVGPGELGVSVINVTPAMARSLVLPEVRGAYVDRIEPGSPASGILRQSDVIFRIGDIDIDTAQDLVSALRNQPLDEPIRVYLYRQGEPHFAAVRLRAE